MGRRILADCICRYCHLATGNYNVRRAGIYSDLGLFTCREAFGEDLTELFNPAHRLHAAAKIQSSAARALGLREDLLSQIRKETEHARAGRPARIIAKVNSLIDPAIIEALYEASRAGDQIDLIVGGMWSLRPGVPELSERIRVLSVVDRYFEHARILYFQNGGEPVYWLASADWMQRNFDRRVEIAFPILDPALQSQLKEILQIQLGDNIKGRWMQPDGSYLRPRGDGEPFALAGTALQIHRDARLSRP